MGGRIGGLSLRAMRAEVGTTIGAVAFGMAASA